MNRTTRSRRLLALVAGASLIVAACGDDDDDAEPAATDAAEPTETTAAEVTETTAAGSVPDTTTEGTGTTTAGTGGETTGTGTAGGDGEVAMTITIDINPEAVWEDGTPITVADFQCTQDAFLNTPGSILTVGYDQVIAVEQGESEQQVVITFNSTYAPYKDLFDRIIKADSVENCSDISGDFQTEFPISAGPYVMESWSQEQQVMAANENWWGEAPLTPRVILVPRADPDTEAAAIKAGEVDFIYPQFFAGIEETLADPNVKVVRSYGGDYEALYFQQLDGPFADPIFREAFSKSIDLDALFQQIYASFAEDQPRLTCGPIVPGPYCPDDIFQDTFDPEGATALLEENGWVKDAQGFWAKDGAAPEIRWIVNTGNTRRESTQDYLIPLLAQAGFNVVEDNCEAECYFQQRLPALDYDLAMYISTAPPDPGYLTPAFTCANVPSEENNFQGQNQQGWCNEEASALMEEADVTIDEEERATMIQDAIRFFDTDHVMLPLFQFPKSGAYRTDRVGGAVEAELNNYHAWRNIEAWEDLDGDGQIVIGAEQWPGCLNPVTECANSSWYFWNVSAKLLPGVWETTNDAQYELTNLAASEPTVEFAE